MKVESIAECSLWTILQYFWRALKTYAENSNGSIPASDNTESNGEYLFPLSFDHLSIASREWPSLLA